MPLHLHADAPRPLFRRVGRRALRVLRPLAAPLLNRIDLRIRSAVDRSETAEALRQADSLTRAFAASQAEDAQRIEARLDGIAGAIGHVTAQVDGLSPHFDALSSRLDSLSSRLDALSSRLDTLSSRLDTSDLKVTATRLDVLAASRAARAHAEAAAQSAADAYSALAAQGRAQAASIAAIQQHLHEAGSVWLEQRLAERLEAVRRGFQDALDTRVDQPLQALGQQVAASGERSAGTLAGLDTRTEALVRRTQQLMQRNVVPLGTDFAVRTEAGYMLLPAEDHGLLIAVMESQGQMEPGTFAVVSSLLRPGSMVVDVGANVGTFTLPLARLVGTGGHVLALEPSPRVASLLQRTMALNGLSGTVTVEACAAGDTDGVAQFSLSPQTTHSSLVPPDDAEEAIEVPLRRLDDLVAPGRRVDLVKIDVEGAELQVWRGMQRLVADNPELAVVLEYGPDHLRRAGETPGAWFAELTAAGHTAWVVDEAAGTVRSPTDSLGDVNILLLRDPPGSRGLRMA